MLNPELISIGKLKQAYELSLHDIDALMFKLLPANVFPYALWQNAYADFWHWSIRATAQRYQLKEPGFPDAGALPEKYFPTSLHRTLVVRFFDEMVKVIEISALEKGFDYIIAATYDEENNFPFLKQKRQLFQALYEEERRIDNWQRVSGPLKIESMQAVDYFCVSESFPDTIVVNKLAALRYFDKCGYGLRHGVKGITQSLVDSAIKAAAQEAPSVSEVAPAWKEPAADIQPQEQLVPIPVPTALWTGKTPEAILAAMRLEKYDDAIIAHVLYVKRRFRNKTDIGKLLDPSEREPSTYRKKTDRLLVEASKMNIIDV